MPKTNKLKTTFNGDIELLYELGALRFVDRTWKQFLNPHVANLADHHFRVAWTALILAKHESVTNTDKILKMALVHDIAESRTGDTNYLQRQYVKRDEQTAIEDMLMNTSIREEFLSLIEEYEKRTSIEAKIVKDADNLDVDLEIREQEASGYQVKGWQLIRNHVAKTKFYTKSAKKLWKQLQTSDPHTWHVNGRNRYNQGDWKK